MNAARKNLWTAAVSAGICAILIAAITLLSIDSSNDFINRRPSTFFTDRTGARAILLVLQKMLPVTDQWRRPFNELPSQTKSSRSTMIVMSPEEALTESEAAILDRWITSGGQLILATNKEWRIRKPSRSRQPAKKEKEEDEYIPQGYLARHGLLAKADISGEAAVAAAVSQRLGAGRILLVSDPYAFSNESLRTTDNAVWIAARTSEWADTVFFDEYHHGFGQRRELLPLIGMFLMSPWGFVCMQLAVAGIVFMLGSKRRFGRPIEELPVERTSPIEAVEALGGLFETARARVLSVRTIHQYLNVQLTALLGYSIDISNPAIRERIAGRSSLSRTELDSYAEAVKHAIDGESTSDAELIRIAREATTISRSFSYGNVRQSSGRPAAAG